MTVNPELKPQGKDVDFLLATRFVVSMLESLSYTAISQYKREILVRIVIVECRFDFN